MEFKKKRKNPNHIADIDEALKVCKNKFFSGITFNNGNVIEKEQKDVTIKAVKLFQIDGNTVKITFETSLSGNTRYTLWKSGRLANIIE